MRWGVTRRVTIPVVSAARSRRVVAVRLLTLLLLPLLVASGCGSFADRGEPGASTTPATGVPTPSPAPTTGPDAFERSGRGADIQLTLPAADADQPYPLVVALHSLHYDGTEPQNDWGLAELARSAGFAVVYPDGVGRSWNAGSCCGPALAAQSDDVGWLRSLIAHLESRYPIDPRRISIVGLSNGGMLAYRYACEHGDELAGVAVVAASLQVAECAPPTPLTAVEVHGGADGHVPYSGAPWSEVLGTAITSVEQSLAPFRAAAGCPPPAFPEDHVRTDANGLPWTAAGAPETLARARPGTATDPAAVGAEDPAIVPAGGQPPAQAPARPGQVPPGTVDVGAVPPAASTPVAVRMEATCASGERVVQFVLPALAHGWPESTGANAFHTANVVWEILKPRRSAVAGPRI